MSETEPETDQDPSGYLTGSLLVAMPGMADQRFAKTVIYVCTHSAEGAMGLVVNKPLDNVTFPDLLKQLEIDPGEGGEAIEIMFGGPVESGRGFVLHSSDYNREATMPVTGGIALTATVDILKAIAGGHGPRRRILTLGYAGWGPGQLDEEILANGWLHVACDENLLFDTEPDARWTQAMTRIGVDPRMLSGQAGHA